MATQGQMLLPRADAITFIKSKKVGGAHFWRISTCLDGRETGSNIQCLKMWWFLESECQFGTLSGVQKEFQELG